jgi:hypothetical protein
MVLCVYVEGATLNATCVRSRLARDISGRWLTVHLLQIEDFEITVADLKEMIEKKLSVTPANQRLIYKGHVLKDNRTVASYCKFASAKLLVSNLYF